MNIAGLVAGRMNDDAVHEPDDRGRFAFANDLFDPVILDGVFLLPDDLQGSPLDLPEDLLQRLGKVIKATDGRFHFLERGDRRPDLPPRRESDIVDGPEVQGVPHGYRDRPFVHAQRKSHVFQRKPFGKQVQGFGLDDRRVQIDVGNAQLNRERPGNLLLGDDAQGAEDFPQALVRFLLLLDGFVELFPGDQVGFEENLTQFVPLEGRRRGGKRKLPDRAPEL